MADPKSKPAAALGMRAVLMATEARLERAVLAPLEGKACQVGNDEVPLEVNT